MLVEIGEAAGGGSEVDDDDEDVELEFDEERAETCGAWSCSFEIDVLSASFDDEDELVDAWHWRHRCERSVRHC